MSPRLPPLLALSAVICAATPATAQKPTYTLTATEHFNKKTGKSIFTQSLRNRRMGRIIWVRHFPGAGNVTWSKDRKAVVFETAGFFHQQIIPKSLPICGSNLERRQKSCFFFLCSQNCALS